MVFEAATTKIWKRQSVLPRQLYSDFNAKGRAETVVPMLFRVIVLNNRSIVFGGVCGENLCNVFLLLFMVLWVPISEALCMKAVLMLWHAVLFLGLRFFPLLFFLLGGLRCFFFWKYFGYNNNRHAVRHVLKTNVMLCLVRNWINLYQHSCLSGGWNQKYQSRLPGTGTCTYGNTSIASSTIPVSPGIVWHAISVH
jgi:hypothetical protein